MELSEEEIIEIIEAVRKKSEYWLTTKQFDALVGLLDLYNKQKDTLISQEKIIMEQEKQIQNYKKQVFGDILKGNYISKDKIRERLEKLKEKEWELSDEQGYWGGSELQARIEELEELLEEK
jgi:hypothetical protein